MDDSPAPVQSDQTTFATSFFGALYRYKNLVFSYWWILCLTTAIGVGIEWYLLRLVPPSFLSTGRLILNVKLSIPNANLYNEELENFFGTQEALMQSDTVINRVRARLYVANPPLNIVPVSISVTVPPKTSIFDLTAEGSDAAYTRMYLQTMMEEYVNLKKELLNNASYTTKAVLEDQLQKIEEEVDTNKEEIFEYQSNNSVVFLQQGGGNNAAERLATLTGQLADEKSELQMLQTLTLDENLERQQGIFARQPPQPQTPQTPATQPDTTQPANNTGQNATPANPAPDNNNANLPSNLGDFETAYLQAKQQILQLTAKRDQMAQYLRPKHPDMIAINTEITNQVALLGIYRGQSQEQLKNRTHILDLQITNLEDQITEWQAKAIDVSEKLAGYNALKEDQVRLQAMYNQLLGTLQTVDADSGISQDSVSIFEPATEAVATPKQVSKHLTMGGIIGLVLGIGILMLLDRLDDRPASYSEMEKIFDEPVVGQIPFMKSKRKKGVPYLQWDDERHILVESYRNLRSGLVFDGSSEKRSKSIVVTSAIPDDGKSMTAANLAITLARAGDRVLLVDADLRRGIIHKNFSLPESPGLTELLSDQCKLAEAIVQTPIPNLYLLPCGTSHRHPGGLFVSGARKFLKEIAAADYDYYVFDTPPVMATDDVSNLAPHVDCVLLIVRAGFTSGRVARAALNVLYSRKARKIGLVLNAVRASAGEYYYYRYPEYYSQRPPA